MEAMLEFRREIVKITRDLIKRYPACSIMIQSDMDNTIEDIDVYLDIKYQLSKPSYCPCLLTLIHLENGSRISTATIWEDHFYMEYTMVDIETETQTVKHFGKVPDTKLIAQNLEMIAQKMFGEGKLEMNIYPDPDELIR